MLLRPHQLEALLAETGRQGGRRQWRFEGLAAHSKLKDQRKQWYASNRAPALTWHLWPACQHRSNK